LIALAGKPCGYYCNYNSDCDQFGSCPFCKLGACSNSPSALKRMIINDDESIANTDQNDGGLGEYQSELEGESYYNDYDDSE
jgi:hypothetical protein